MALKGVTEVSSYNTEEELLQLIIDINPVSSISILYYIYFLVLAGAVGMCCTMLVLPKQCNKFSWRRSSTRL